MGFREMLEKVMNRGQDVEREELDDDETRDKFLRSLRRQRRTQLEEVEKEQLQKDIGAFEKERLRKNLFGFKTEMQKREEKRNQLIKAIDGKQKLKVFQERRMIGRANLGKKRVKKGPQGFLMRGNL